MKYNIPFIALLLFSIVSISFAQKNSTTYLSKVGEVDSVHSSILGEDREIYIQLPASYDAQKNTKYPVAYIVDGEFLLPNLNMAYESYYGGFVPEMILVGIANLQHRNRDLTPSKVETLFGRPAQMETGKADQFRKFIESELIPFIDNKYRTTSFRTLIGHSYGGLFVIHSLLEQPNLFSNYIAIDPSLQWDEQYILKDAAQKLKKEEFKNVGLYISLAGQLHNQKPSVTIDNVMEDSSEFTLFARSNITFKNLVEENNYISNFEWEFFPKDLHGTVVYPSLRGAFLSIFSWYQMEKTELFNDPETPINDLEKLITHRAEKLKAHFGYIVPPYPEDLINVQGYMNIDMNQMDKAKMYFDFNIKFYPNSANCYDSMADYYAHQKDFKNAFLCVEKAYKLNPTPYYKERMNSFSQKNN